MRQETEVPEHSPQGDFLSDEDLRKWEDALATDDKKFGSCSHSGHVIWKGSDYVLCS